MTTIVAFITIVACVALPLSLVLIWIFLLRWSVHQEFNREKAELNILMAVLSAAWLAAWIVTK